MIKKRTLSLLLSLVMLLSLLPADARAETVGGDGFTYDTESKTLTVTGFDPDFSDFAQKSEVKHVLIGSGAGLWGSGGTLWLAQKFSDFTGLVSFAVESGNDAYRAAEGVLFSLDGKTLICYPAQKPGGQYLLPDGVTTVAQKAFYGESGQALELFARSDVKSALNDSVNIYRSSTDLYAKNIKLYDTDVEQIALSESALTLQVNVTGQSSATLTYAVAPDGASMTAALWSSDNESVAVVDQNGTVTAVAAGTANITATTLGVDGDGSHLSASCAVTVERVVTEDDLVIPEDTPGANNEIIAVDADPEEGDSPATLQVSIGDEATNRTVTWTSGDSSIATLEAVSAVSARAETADGQNAVFARLIRADAATQTIQITAGADNIAAVRVVPRGTGTVTITAAAGTAAKTFTLSLTKWVDSVSLDAAPLYLAPDGEAALTATILPDGVDSGRTTAWSADGDGAVVTVDQTGKVAAVAEGDATVSVSVTTGSRTKTAERAVRVRSVSLSAAPPLQPGDSAVMTASVLPADAADKAVTWASSDESVAAVDQTGKVTARAVGTTVISAALSAAGASSIRAERTVTVTAIPVTGVTVSPAALALTLVGGDSGAVTGQLTAAVLPEDATNKAVEWSSSDTSVVTVDETGKVTAVNAGAAIVTATAKDGSGSAGSCAVTVSDGALTLDRGALTLRLGGSASADDATLTATLSPIDATARSVTWESSDGSVVTVSGGTTAIDLATGSASVTLHAQKAGRATVTARVGARTASCAVTVEQAASGVALTGTAPTLKLYENENTGTLTASVTPADVTDEIVWISSHPNVVRVDGSTYTVDADAVVSTAAITAVGGGSARITVSCGGQEASVTLTVKPLASGVTLGTSALTLREKGATGTLTASVTPADAENKTIRWSSSDADVVTVGTPTLDAETGVSTVTVTAVGPGTATVVAASADDEAVSASVTVNVTVAATGITLNTNALTVRRETGTANTGTLTATVAPPDTTDGPVAWASSDPTVVAVGSETTEIGKTDGKTSVTLNALKAGTAVITASAGGKTAVCTVTVEQATEALSLPDTLSLTLHGAAADSAKTLTATRTPSDATDAVTWSSDNTAVATVDQSGRVAAVGAGTATITAVSNGKRDACAVTVTDYQVKSFVTAPQDITVLVDETGTLSAKLGPDHATDKTVYWASGDPTVASLGTPTLSAETGVSSVAVSAHKAGTVTVTATSADNAAVTATCTVTVPDVSVTGLTLSQTALNVRLDKNSADSASRIVTAAVAPSNATHQGVVWSVVPADSGVIELAADGARVTVTAKKAGSATLVATSEDDAQITAQCAVTVTQAAESLTLTPAGFPLSLIGAEAQKTGTLTATVSPADVTDEISWSVSGTVVTLGGAEEAAAEGNKKTSAVAVTAVRGGTAYVTVTAGDFSETYAVDVPVPVSGITLDQTALSIEKDRTATLTAAVSPDDAAVSTVTWESSDETVATVVNGVVTAHQLGTATITATADGGKDVSATCAVTVVPVAVTGFRTRPAATAAVERGETATLTASVAPADAANQTVYWVSSDADVVAVGEPALAEGVSSVVVTAKAVGSATVTATTADGGYTASCIVTVPNHAVTALSMPSSLTLYRNIPESDSTHKSSAELSVDIRPANTTDSFVWRSSNPDVAEIGEASYETNAAGTVKTGKVTVTAKSGGTATITLVASGGKSAQTSVTVNVFATGVTLDKSSLTLQAGGTAALTAAVAPDDAANKTLEWSSDSDKVSVAGGVITTDASITEAVTATVTAKTTDGTNRSASCTVTVKPIPVAGVTLSHESITLQATKMQTLTAAVSPANAADKRVAWSSDNESVATVDANGKVTAVAVGLAHVTAKAKDGSEQSASCTVTVEATAAEGISLSEEELTIDAQAADPTAALTAAVTPSYTTNQAVTWSSSDSTVASVTGGVVTAHKPGTVTITVSADSNPSVRALCTVTVTATSVTGVTLGKASTTLNVGESEQLAYTVAPSDAFDKGVSWRSGNTAIAEVNGEGVVTAKAKGTTTVTVLTDDGSKTAVCVVTVRQPVSGVTLDRDSGDNKLALTVGAEGTLTAAVAPSTADNQAVEWSSDNPAVATVDQTGKVTAVGVGSAVITAASAEDGEISASCTVVVSAVAVTSVTVAPTTAELKVGAQRNLTVGVLPDAATNRTVTWTSSDASVATVTRLNETTATVTAVAAGTATVTATSADGTNIEAACAVTVLSAVGGVSLNKTSTTLTLGASPVTETLTAAVTPAVAGASVDESVTWSSLNPTVATVDSAGVVTAAGPGTATILATANDGGKSASCVVTVLRPASAVTLSATSLGLSLTDSAKRSGTLTVTVTPADTTDAIIWSVESEDDAITLGPTVTSVTGDALTGTVTIYANAAGTASVTAKAGSVTGDACTVTVEAPTGDITLDRYALSLTKGASAKLIPTVLPADAADKTVTWESSDEDVATVASDGAVTAVAVGSATVTARAKDGQSAQCVITVKPVLVGSIAISGSKALKAGETLALTAEAGPDEADNKAVNWSSDNTSVASVNNSGVVTALSVGTATVTAAAADGGGAYNTVAVTVEATPVSSVSLNEASLAFDLADATLSAQLLAAVSPDDATDGRLTWTSSNASVASVSDDGLVTALAVGTATVTARSAADAVKFAACAVTVTATVTGVALSQATLTLPVGESETLTAAIRPAGASGETVTWTSGNENVATVDANGKITAVAAGTANITAAAGGVTSASCAVTVPTPVTGVSIADANETLTLSVGESAALRATVLPADAADKRVSWRSSDETVATVDSDGTVRAIAAGSAAVSVTTTDGGKTASRAVRVVRKATSIVLSAPSLSLAAGESAQLSATLSAGTTDTGVAWASSDTEVATVSAAGVVKGVGAGTATITATTKDGSALSADCDVTVSLPVTGVSIRKDGAEISSLALHMLDTPTANLTASITPSDATDPVVSWASSDESVVTVSGSGRVTAVGGGSAEITVTVTAGGKTRSAGCDVTVEKAAISADVSSLTLLPDNKTGSVKFSPCAGDAAITLSGDNDGVVQVENSFAGNTRTYAFTARKNGVVTLSWSKAADASYTAGSGTISIVSLVDPITGVSVDASKLAAGCALTASLDASARTIRVAGYVNGDPASYDLSDKLVFVLAGDIVSGLSAEYADGSVIVKRGETAICTYAVQRGGIVSLPENVSLSVTMLAPAETSVSSVDLAGSSVRDTEAALAAVKSEAGVDIDNSEEELNVEVAIRIVPTSETTGSVVGYQTVAFDIEPTYTISNAAGDTVEEGALSEFASAVTLTVKVSFQPTLIVHKHGDATELITPSCVPAGDGDYLVSWTQSSFSSVELLSESAAEAYLAEQHDGGDSTPSAPRSYPSYSGGGGSLSAGAKPAEPAKPAESAPAPKTFSDVATNHWAAEAIGYVSARGILNGVGDNRFAPERTASRAMIAQLLFNFDDGDKSAADASPFADASGKWYERAAGWAAALGVAGGSYGSFQGDDAVTREQLAAMLYRYAKAKGYDLTADDAALGGFADADAVSDWAGAELRWAVGKGLIGGTDRGLEPRGGATRAQVAMIMMRFCETVVK